MGFFTRPDLINQQFKQLSGGTLTLSGETNFVGTLKSKGVEIDASTGGTFAGYGLILDTDGVIRLKPFSGGSGSGIYDGATPSTISVGGIPAGTTLTGRTFESLWEQLLVVYQAPTFSSFVINGIPALSEVGDPASFSGNKTFTWSTTNSSNVQANTITIRDVTNGNTILGTGLANDGVETLPLSTVISNTTPITHTWSINGTNTESNPIPQRTRTIESIYPWFFGRFDGGAVASGVNRPDPSNPTVAQSLLDNFEFKLIEKSNGTLTVFDFGSDSQDYIWIAVPATSTVKTRWYVNALDNGVIGGAVSAGGNLFPTPVTVTVDEPEGSYWTGVQYRFYVSNKQLAATIMEFRNS